jgi:hypothetical protein
MWGALDRIGPALHGRAKAGGLDMRWAALLFSVGVLAASPVSALTGRNEVVPAERRVLPYDANIPGCDNTGVLAKVAQHFAEKEAKFWNSNLQIVQYENVRRIAWRPWGLDYIPRRFCTATVWISDGRKTRVDYSVREDLGIISATWGVEFCVHGLDRNWAFNPACKMARP